MESLIGVLVGISLSAASGLRVFIPLLGMSIASHYKIIPLSDSFLWLASWQAMLAFGVASVVEVAAYYLPWLDHILDVILAPLAATAGTILTASTLGDISPFLKWSLAIVAGGGLSSLVHFGSATVRAAFGVPTGGLANPLVSSSEGLGSILLTLLAIFLPLLAIVVVLWLVYIGIKRLNQNRTNT
ncbi:MAG TPA: DUF4126 domain-containing protein [Arenimonas sp.]|nr:DUF4126 domain-containing protein [Arenimonas sp.]